MLTSSLLFVHRDNLQLKLQKGFQKVPYLPYEVLLRYFHTVILNNGWVTCTQQRAMAWQKRPAFS